VETITETVEHEKRRLRELLTEIEQLDAALRARRCEEQGLSPSISN